MIDQSGISKDSDLTFDVTTRLFALVDSDGHGAADIFDTDDDNDNIPDSFDSAPLEPEENVSPRDFVEIVGQGGFVFEATDRDSVAH